MPLINLPKILNHISVGRQKTQDLFIDLWRFSYIKIYSLVFFIVNLVNWCIAYYINLQAANDNIISLHNNVDFGVNLIGDSSQVYLMPFLGLLIFIFNFFLLMIFYKKNRFIPHLLLSAAILFNIVMLISLDLINLINFR